MDFRPTEAQEMVRASVRRFLEKEIAPLDREYGDREMTPELARGLLKRLIPFGYMAIGEAEDPIAEAILFEELARVSPSLLGIQFIATITAWAVRDLAHPTLVARLAEPMANGDLIGCSAITEPDVGSDPTGVRCRAVRQGDHYLLSGNKLWISNGHIADVVLVQARFDDGEGAEALGQIIVDRSETPFVSRDVDTLGLRAFPTSELFIDGLRIPAINRLQPPPAQAHAGRAPKAPDFRAARVFCALASCGIASKAFDLALDYVKQRKQFGQEIGRFQLVQGMLADMAMDLEAARLLTYRARQHLQTGTSQAEISMAKAYATEMGVRVTSKAMECMGAMGLAREAQIERLFRDARMWIVPDGTGQIQRLVIGRELTGFSAIRP